MLMFLATTHPYIVLALGFVFGFGACAMTTVLAIRARRGF